MKRGNEILEESLLVAVDTVKEQERDQGTKGIRQCPTMQDDEKDDLIQKGKEMIPTIKGVATQVLLNKGIKIIG